MLGNKLQCERLGRVGDIFLEVLGSLQNGLFGDTNDVVDSDRIVIIIGEGGPSTKKIEEFVIREMVNV